MSSAPASVAADATIIDWDNNVLRVGTNDWTCFPDAPNSDENDPMCIDEPWLKWLDAWVSKTEPVIDRMGFGYMLAGGVAASNVDPFAEGPTPDNEWREGVPHVMIVVPDTTWLRGIPTDDKRGGPFVRWQGSPYVHIVAPLPGR